MARSFQELGKKAEDLIERGNEADRDVQRNMANVSSAAAQVSRAHAVLMSTHETDDDGNSNPAYANARTQFNIAQNRLAASQRALDAAQQAANQIRQEKDAHVRELARYNQTARSNLEKLRQLHTGAFAENASAMTREMAQRFNEAEDTRVALLRSMGIEATADHIDGRQDGASGAPWSGGGFAALDLSGRAESYRGGSGEGLPSGTGGLPTPPGGAFAAPRQIAANDPYWDEMADAARNGKDLTLYLQHYDQLAQHIIDQPMSNQQKLAELKELRRRLQVVQDLQNAQIDAAALRQHRKFKRLPVSDYYDMSCRYIERYLEVCRDNLHGLGIEDGPAMEAALQQIRADLNRRLDADLAAGTYIMCDHPTPDFRALADQMRALYGEHPSTYRYTEHQRAQLREGVRTGTVTEREIRTIGRDVRQRYDTLLKTRNEEAAALRDRRTQLIEDVKHASTRQEQEALKLRQKLLIQDEENWNRQYDHPAMMQKVLSQFRPMGTPHGSSAQVYLPDPSQSGTSRVIRAINDAQAHLPTDWVLASEKRPIVPECVERGYFYNTGGADIIALNRKADRMQACSYHELGHRFEHMYPEILKLEKQFYDRRTAGESLQHLGPGYDESEKSRFDHFVSAYMGKDYGGQAYELLSMGMESVYCKSYNLAMDPEYENFILGILAVM